MTTRLDSLNPANAYPARLGRRDRKVLTEVKAEIDESVAAASAAASAALAALIVASGQATTGADGTAGEIAITDMTAAGVVIVTAAEALGNNIVISHVVAAEGKITVYAQNTNADGAATALSGALVNYIVVSL